MHKIVQNILCSWRCCNTLARAGEEPPNCPGESFEVINFSPMPVLWKRRFLETKSPKMERWNAWRHLTLDGDQEWPGRGAPNQGVIEGRTWVVEGLGGRLREAVIPLPFIGNEPRNPIPWANNLRRDIALTGR